MNGPMNSAVDVTPLIGTVCLSIPLKYEGDYISNIIHLMECSYTEFEPLTFLIQRLYIPLTLLLPTDHHYSDPQT
jgi:hypothetical protein